MSSENSSSRLHSSATLLPSECSFSLMFTVPASPRSSTLLVSNCARLQSLAVYRQPVRKSGSHTRTASISPAGDLVAEVPLWSLACFRAGILEAPGVELLHLHVHALAISDTCNVDWIAMHGDCTTLTIRRVDTRVNCSLRSLWADR